MRYPPRSVFHAPLAVFAVAVAAPALSGCGASPCDIGARECRGEVLFSCRSGSWEEATDCSTLGQTCANGRCMNLAVVDGDFEQADTGEHDSTEFDTADRDDPTEGEDTADAADGPDTEEEAPESDAPPDGDADPEPDREADAEPESEADRTEVEIPLPDIGCDVNDRDTSRARGCAMLHMINADRAMFPEESNNAKPLVWDEALYPVVLGHAQDMCNRDFFAHENPDGKSPFDRMADQGVTYQYAGENIARNPWVDDAQYRFMAECTCPAAGSNHRTNVLERNFTRAAVAVIDCTRHPTYGLYMVQNFRSKPGEPFYRTNPYCAQATNKNRKWPDPPSSETYHGGRNFGPVQLNENHYTECTQ